MEIEVLQGDLRFDRVLNLHKRADLAEWVNLGRWKMANLLVRGAELLVIMDEKRREIGIGLTGPEASQE